MRDTLVFAGSWTVQAKDMKGGGFSVYRYDEASGALEYRETLRTDLVAGSLHVDSERGVLYVGDETTHSPVYANRGGGGRVAAFKIDPDTGSLTELGEQPAFGTLTSYLTEGGDGRWLVAVNHGDKQVITKVEQDEQGTYRVRLDISDCTAVVYPLAEDGAILSAKDVRVFPHDFTSNPVRISCLHSANFAPDDRHCLIVNMKQDEICMFEVDPETGRLNLCEKLERPKGYAPRYAAFHPAKPLFYLNNEHKFVIEVYRYDEDGHMTLLQSVDCPPVYPQDMTGKKVLPTDIHIRADGRFVYAAYRGANVIKVFAVDPENGFLTEMQNYNIAEGEGNPRGFAIAPDGRFLVAADTQHHLVRSIAVQEDGTLTPTVYSDGHQKYPGPVAFYKPPVGEKTEER